MNAKRIAATIPALGLAAAALSTMPAHAQLTGGTTKSPEVLVIRKVDAADNRYIGADSNAYHSVAQGATFAGDSCTRGGDDLNWNCEDLNDYAWFHDMLPEDGNTDGYYNREIPLTSSPDGSVVQRVDVAETSAPTGYDKIDGTSTVHLDPATNTWVADALPAGVTLTHSNGFAYWSWNDKPVEHPTPVVTHVPAVTKTTHVPAVTKTVTTPAHQTALVQIDTYNNQFSNGRKLTTTQIKTRDAARAADKKAGKLVYRKGSAATWLWGSTSSKIVTVDLCNAPKLGADTDLWVLGAGATKANPWGASHNVVQTSAKADCAATTRTVVVTPAHDVTTVVTPAHDVTTYVCSDGTVMASASDVCEAKHGGGAIGGSYGG